MNAADIVGDSDEDVNAYNDDHHLRPVASEQKHSSACSASQDPPAIPDHTQISEKNHADDATNADAKNPDPIQLRSFVMVQSRTWPGINKPGGPGRVIAICELSDQSFAYDIRYVFGGIERNVLREYIHLSDLLEKAPAARAPAPRRYYHDEFGGVTRKSGDDKRQRRQKTIIEKGGAKTIETKGINVTEKQDHFIEDRDRPMQEEMPCRGRKRRRIRSRLTVADSDVRTRKVSDVGTQDNFSSSGDSADTTLERKSDNESLAASSSDVDTENLRVAELEKRQLFVGGYRHGGQDADSAFIQPEDNAMDLPDDVRLETHFKLAKSYRGLMRQLKTRSLAFESLLEIFESQKSSIDLLVAPSIAHSELDAMYTKILQLEQFLRKDLVRSGEDIVDMILRKMESIYNELPEKLELQHDERKRRVAECGSWLREVKSHVLTIYDAKRLDLPKFMNQKDQENTSMDEEVSVSSTEEQFGYDEPSYPIYTSQPIEEEFGHISKRRSQRITHNAFDHLQRRAIHTKHIKNFFHDDESDNYLNTTAEQILNEKSAKIRITPRMLAAPNCRWDWKKILGTLPPKRKSSNYNERSYSTTSISGSYPRKKVSSGKLSASFHKVHAKVRRLREQREAYAPKNYQRSRASEKEHASPVRVLESVAHEDTNAVDWDAVFYVINNDTTPVRISDLEPLNEQAVQNLLAFEYIFTEETDFCEPLLDSVSDKWTEKIGNQIRCEALLFRQLLNILRWKEADVMASNDSMTQEGLETVAEYQELLHLESRCKESLLSLCRLSIRSMRSLKHHTEQAANLLRISLSMIKLALCAIPCCADTIGRYAGYYMYFQTAKTTSTPLISTIASTFWLILQWVHILWSLTQEHEALKQIFASVLLPNRVILAASLYLVDLYTYIPSSHDPTLHENLNLIQTPKQFPALSLWLLIYRCYAAGHGKLGADMIKAFEDAHVRATDTAKDFWVFIQMLSEHGFIQALVSLFHAQKPLGTSYSCMAVSSQVYNDEDNPDCAFVAEVTIMVFKIKLELLVILTRLCSPTSSALDCQSEDAEKWELVKSYLNFTKPQEHVLNFPCLEDVLLGESFQNHLEALKSYVLQYVLLLSQYLAPCSDMVEFLAVHYFTNYTTAHESSYRLPWILRTLDPGKGQPECPQVFSKLVIQLTLKDEANWLHLIDIFCSIVLVQMVKFVKSIHRSRLRQKLVRAFANKCSNISAARPSQHTTSTQKSCDAGSNFFDGGNSSIQNRKALKKSYHATSILMTLAFISIQFDCNTEQMSAAKVRNERQRYRDVEFFCTELKAQKVFSEAMYPLLSQAFAYMGKLVLTKDLNLLILVLQYYDSFMEDSARLFHQRRHAKVSNSCDKRALPDETPVLLDFIALAEYFFKNMSEIKIFFTEKGNLEILTKCFQSILGSGLASWLEGTVHDQLSYAILKKIVSILWTCAPMHKTSSVECLKVAPLALHDTSTLATREGHKYDDDEDMLALLANVDLEHLQVAHDRTVDTGWTLDKARDYCEAGILHCLLGRFRLPLQRILLSAQMSYVNFNRHYLLLNRLLRLCGYIIALSTSPFTWSAVSRARIQKMSPFIAPRLFTAIMTYAPKEKDWLSKNFLGENNSDTAFIQMWLMATMDISALSSLIHDNLRQDYWCDLTDKLIFEVLNVSNSRLRSKVEPLVFQCLQETFSRCYESFTEHITGQGSGSHIYKYRVRYIAFSAFCKSVRFTVSCAMELQGRDGLRVFQSKMIDRHHGIFSIFPEIYTANIKQLKLLLATLKDLAWMRSSLKLEKIIQNCEGRNSFHQLDEAFYADVDKHAESGSRDQALHLAVNFFKFMYECVQVFLLHCSELAVGQENIFFVIIELMFRQSTFAENERIANRLVDADTFTKSISAISSSFKDDEAAVVGWIPLIESIRTHFAQQSYPYLIRWFAQTQERYRTLEDGWKSSKLRVLLMNALDYDGPLGSQSYYPDDSTQCGVRQIALSVRREAYFLSCGLMICTHMAVDDNLICGTRIRKLCQFILTQFLSEQLEDADFHGTNVFVKTLLPCAQFVKAYLHHCKLNIQNLSPDSSSAAASPFAALPFINTMATYLFIDNHSERLEVVRCVLLIELCGIIYYLLEVFHHCDRWATAKEAEQWWTLLHLSMTYLGFISCKLTEYKQSPRMQDPSFSHYSVHTDSTLSVDSIKRKFLTQNELLRYGHKRVRDTMADTREPEDFTIDTDRLECKEALLRVDLLCSIRSILKWCSQIESKVEEVTTALQMFKLGENTSNMNA